MHTAQQKWLADPSERTITIYHSCDPPEAPTLHHFKAGKYTIYHPQLDPHVSAPLVLVPKRKGKMEQVPRCMRPECDACANTDVFTDLTFEVAMSHSIRRAPLKPSPKARTAAERLADGQLRGQWIYGDLKPGELMGKVLHKPRFHLYAEDCKRVLDWMDRIPVKSEKAYSESSIQDLDESKLQRTSKPAKVPGLGDYDSLAVGAEHSRLLVQSAPREQQFQATVNQLRHHVVAEQGIIDNMAQGRRDSLVMGHAMHQAQAPMDSLSPHSPRAPWQASMLPRYFLRHGTGPNTELAMHASHQHHVWEAPGELFPTARALVPAEQPVIVGQQVSVTPRAWPAGGSISILDCFPSARTPDSFRHIFQPEQLPSPPYPGISPRPLHAPDLSIGPAYQARNCQAAEPPHFNHAVHYGLRNTRPRLLTPPTAKFVEQTSPGEKRTCENAGLVAQERRKRTRYEL